MSTCINFVKRSSSTRRARRARALAPRAEPPAHSPPPPGRPAAAAMAAAALASRLQQSMASHPLRFACEAGDLPKVGAKDYTPKIKK